MTTHTFTLGSDAIAGTANPVSGPMMARCQCGLAVFFDITQAVYPNEVELQMILNEKWLLSMGEPVSCEDFIVEIVHFK